MKRIVALLLLFSGLALVATAASHKKPKHRVVFDASTGEETWEGILNNVENLRKAFGSESSEVEVVAHGKALGLLLKDGKYAERVSRIAASGVVFAACENTMRRQNVTREGLNPSATTVPSGVAEVVHRQEQGWAYVKAGA